MCFCEKSTTEWKHKMLVLFWYAQTSAEVYVILKLKKKWEPLVHWNPKSNHSNQILVYGINDIYFCVDSSKSFCTLEKEALRSKRRAESVAT